MRTSQNPISTHRVQRFTRWAHVVFAVLVAQWAAWLAGGGLLTRRSLDGAARIAATLVLMHARARLPNRLRNSGKHRHGRLNEPGWMRKLLGARVRNALRGRDFGARLHAILCFVRDLDKHVRRLARRLRNSLTRQRILDPLAYAESCRAQAYAAIAAADSS